MVEFWGLGVSWAVLRPLSSFVRDSVAWSLGGRKCVTDVATVFALLELKQCRCKMIPFCFLVFSFSD